MSLKAFGAVNQLRYLPSSCKWRKKKHGIINGEATCGVIGEHVQAQNYLPAIGDEHPFNANIYLEDMEITIVPEGVIAQCTYGGCDEADLNRPTYEFNSGEEDQPIEVHPRFQSNIGGTPASPLNGAMFTDTTGALTTDNTAGIFAGFRNVLVDGGGPYLNPFSGVEAFVDISSNYYTESYVARELPDDETTWGTIVTPPGPASQIRLAGANRNWLYLGYSFRERGRRWDDSPSATQFIVYEIFRRWRLSGPKGWNATIY